MSLEINNVILKIETIHKDLVLLYQLKAIGRNRAATDLSLKINNDMLEAAVLFANVTKNTLSDEINKQPQLRLI